MTLFRKHLASSKKGYGGILFLVDSASKHPTGGDLVHGVIRVCGHRKSVDVFFKNYFGKHLDLTLEVHSAYKLTTLSPAEQRGRKRLIENRLVMRNLDFWRWFDSL